RMMRDMGVDAMLSAASLSKASRSDDYQRFELADAATSDYRFADPARVRPVYFRLPSGLVPAYYGELQVQDKRTGETRAWSYVIDATWGKLLFRRDLTQYENFSYRVFAETTGDLVPLPGPQGRQMFPHPTGTPDNSVPGPFLTPNLLMLESAPFGPGRPWLPAGATQTVGNNVDAYADLDQNDGFQGGDIDLHATTTSANTFDYTYDTDVDPLASTAQSSAAVVNLFYINNWLHDWFYDSGFDESAGNAQGDNFGLGGVPGDSLRAEAQDRSGLNGGINNANMATPADGGRPRMQMYMFRGTELSKQLDLTGGVMDTPDVSSAVFGPASFDVTGDVVLVNDGTPNVTDACEPIANDVSGKIALVDRGTCSFVTKLMNAENAGAIGVILANNVAGNAPPGMSGDDPGLITPILSVTYEVGQAIRGAGPTVTAHLQRESAVRKEGSLDSGVVMHEWGHYISNRLVQNSAGLVNQQGGGMGEGWGDFHAQLGLFKDGDPLDGAYAIAGYDLGGPIPDNSYYYGFRRYPYSTDMNKNPLTFKHIENGVALPVSPAPAFGATGVNNAEVHNTGEVWATALWECYAGLLGDTGRLSFTQAQDRMKAYLVGGYKMTPASPTFVEARDALLSVIAAQDIQDFDLCAAGFAKRGMGVGAVAPVRNSSTNSGVVESFTNVGSVPQGAIVEVTDDVLSCDSDGILDDGEIGHVRVTAGNTGFSSMTGATVTLSSPDTELMFVPDTENVAAVQPYATTDVSIPVSMNGSSGVFPFTVNAQINHADAGAAASFSKAFVGNFDELMASSSTEGFEVTSPNWGTDTVGGLPQPWILNTVSFDDHRAYGIDAGSLGLIWLRSPALQVSASGDFVMTLDSRFKFEHDGTPWDGGVIEISTDGGNNWVDAAAAGAAMTPAYGDVITDLAGNPLANRSAYVGQSAAWPDLSTIELNFGTAFAGQSVMIRFVIGTDEAVGEFGWEIDNVAFSGIDNTPFGTVVAEAGTCVLADEIFANGFED
ncbi:MAG: M36 family metallopeptidase, partial [Xanthomonadales bacterium]|nr:M36 family metallopeptidase [Xanthomonadales bacterium]